MECKCGAKAVVCQENIVWVNPRTGLRQRNTKWECVGGCGIRWLEPSVQTQDVKIEVQDYVSAQRGVACPKCGNVPWEVKSTPKTKGVKVRYHKCGGCGHTGKSTENT